ncbi:Autophagy protein 22 [Elasticomyces elasticus]|nr:Autophagy protein 22 [Elasticomyces elasticus]KAK4993077.1 Autophagy protein 22 [Elasticomyces elasticus]
MTSPSHEAMLHPQGYPGEDTRLTSRRELLGFYAYSFAAEVFVICGIGSFIPITLEQLARERGVLLSDRTTPCTSSADLPASDGNISRAPLHARLGNHNDDQCVVSIFGAEINTASFAMYTFSISVLLQALLVITMSGAADHGRYRKTLLLVFAFTGALTTMLFLPVTSSVYLLGSLLAIVGNVCFGASFVLLNSFLPLLVRHHPTVQSGTEHSTEDEYTASEDHEAGRTISEDEAVLEDATAALLPSLASATYSPSASALSSQLQLSTQISSYGIGIGYIAAVLIQTLSVVIILATGSTTFSLRLVLFVVGVWWFVFSIPAAYWLRPRPGPPLLFDDNNRGKCSTWLAHVTYSWRNLYATAKRARKLKDILLFLAAWFMISDAIATVSGTAILFAKTTLHMKPAALSLINVVVMLSGVFGAFTWSKLSRVLELKPSQTILACICLFEIIPIYGLLGYIPAIRRFGSFGLQQPWEMYPLGAVYGLVLGGLSSYCRSLFGELIPPGSEAAFFALYAITDKGSSIFGPAIVGAITDATGEIRPAFWFLAVLIGLPLPLMLLVDVDRGKREGAAMARKMAISGKPTSSGERLGGTESVRLN